MLDPLNSTEIIVLVTFVICYVLSFSAVLSSKPSLLVLSTWSSFRHCAKRAVISSALTNAICKQWCNADASIGNPPAFAIWHTSPYLFSVIVISPSRSCSSCSVASTRVASHSRPKYENETQIGTWITDNGIGTRLLSAWTVTLCPSTDTSGHRKCWSAATTAMQDASMSPPSWFRKCTSARMCQHFWPPTMQRDSESIALERRMDFSINRASRTSCSVWLYPN